MTGSNPSLEDLLTRLGTTGEAGEAALRYLTERRLKVHVRKQHTGARWTLFGNIHLNPAYAEGKNDPYALSLIVHEVEHLKQGWHKALSVQGELEAWQTQFTFLKTLATAHSANYTIDPVIVEMLSLDPSSRDDLKLARALMQTYAGKKYRIDLLPLYPLWMEICLWLGIGKPRV